MNLGNLSSYFHGSADEDWNWGMRAKRERAREKILGRDRMSSDMKRRILDSFDHLEDNIERGNEDRAERSSFQHGNILGRLNSDVRIRYSNHLEQRFIMSDDNLMDLLDEFLICGYSETYRDELPGARGYDRIENRMLDEGCIVDDPDDEDGELQQWWFDDLEDVPRLTLKTVVDIEVARERAMIVFGQKGDLTNNLTPQERKRRFRG